MKIRDEQTLEGQDWIALIEAESLTGYHPKYIKQLVAAGKVAATGGGRGRGHSVRVSRASLLRYKARMDVRAAALAHPHGAAESPASILSAFLAPGAAELAAAKPDENGYTKSHIWLTDSLDTVLELMEMPCVCVIRKTDARKVGEMVRQVRVMQKFSSQQTAKAVAKLLGIETADASHSPAARNGDAVIVVQVVASEAGFAPTVGFVLAQVLT